MRHRPPLTTLIRLTALQPGSVQVFAFSAENWSREAGEVSFLMDLLTRALEGQASELAARDIRLTVIGDHAQLPQQLKDRIAK